MDTSSAVHDYDDGERLSLASNRPKKKAGRRRHPVYHGVRQRDSGKWVSELREPNKKSRIWLGTYPAPEMAARAHDVAALALKGRSACLNFADSAWLPVPASKDARDIQIAAAEAAEAFRAPEEPEKNGGEFASSRSGFGGGFNERRDWEENEVYVDEEAIYDTPGLLMSMAEGLLLSPPRPCYYGNDFGCSEGHVDMSLWNF